MLKESRKLLCTRLEDTALPTLIGMSDLAKLLTSLFPLDFRKVQDTGIFSHDPNVGIPHSQLNPQALLQTIRRAVDVLNHPQGNTS